MNFHLTYDMFQALEALRQDPSGCVAMHTLLLAHRTEMELSHASFRPEFSSLH